MLFPVLSDSCCQEGTVKARQVDQIQHPACRGLETRLCRVIASVVSPNAPPAPSLPLLRGMHYLPHAEVKVLAIKYLGINTAAQHYIDDSESHFAIAFPVSSITSPAMALGRFYRSRLSSQHLFPSVITMVTD